VNPLARRLAGFVSIPMLASVSPLLLIPLIARSCSEHEWASIAVGQSVGGIAMGAVIFGWSYVGPPRLALARTRGERRRIYSQSFWIKSCLFLLVATVGGVVTYVLTRSETPALGIGMFVSTASNAFNLTWFGVGIGSPRLVLRFSLVPQITGVVLTAIAVIATGNVYAFPLFTLVAPLVGVLYFHRQYLGRLIPRWIGTGELVRLVRQDYVPAVINAIASVYTSAPVPVTSMLFGVGPTAQFASADKLYRYGLFAVTSLGDGLQSWVVGADSGARKKNLGAIAAHAAIGVAGAGFLWTVGPFATEILFGSHLGAPRNVLAGFALAYAAVALTTPFIRNILVPVGLSIVVFQANVVALIVGGLVLALLHSHGAASVSYAFAATELTTMAVCIARSVGYMRRTNFLEQGAVGATRPVPAQATAANISYERNAR